LFNARNWSWRSIRFYTPDRPHKNSYKFYTQPQICRIKCECVCNVTYPCGSNNFNHIDKWNYTSSSYWSIEYRVHANIIYIIYYQSIEKTITLKELWKPMLLRVFVTLAGFFLHILSFFPPICTKPIHYIIVEPLADRKSTRRTIPIFDGIFPPARSGAFFISIVFVKTIPIYKNMYYYNILL